MPTARSGGRRRWLGTLHQGSRPDCASRSGYHSEASQPHAPPAAPHRTILEARVHLVRPFQLCEPPDCINTRQQQTVSFGERSQQVRQAVHGVYKAAVRQGRLTGHLPQARELLRCIAHLLVLSIVTRVAAAGGAGRWELKLSALCRHITLPTDSPTHRLQTHHQSTSSTSGVSQTTNAPDAHSLAALNRDASAHVKRPQPCAKPSRHLRHNGAAAGTCRGTVGGTVVAAMTGGKLGVRLAGNADCQRPPQASSWRRARISERRPTCHTRSCHRAARGAAGGRPTGRAP